MDISTTLEAQANVKRNCGTFCVHSLSSHPPFSNTLELQRSHCWQTKSLTPFLYVKKKALNCPIDQIMSNVAQNIVNFNLPDISVSIFPGHLTLPKLITNVRLVVVVGVDACVAFLVVCKGRSQLRRRSIRATAAPPISHTPDNNIGARACGDSAPRLEPRVEC